MATPASVINGRYQLKGRPIGQGGMGIVYKAYDIITKRDVALKTLRGTLHPAALELFSKEWTVLARISHPNIIDILDTGEFEQDGQRKPFFVMPLLPGVTLDQLIENASTRLTVERVVGIAAQTCRGLQAAHEHGLIHRDLKPSNIFVMDDDTVKIIDFGVVHLAGADSIKGIKGTLQYMAPEQIEMKPASPASDTFSLGVVCYQALTGRKPFARKTEAETVDAIRRYIPPPVCELNPLVSQIVSRVIHKAMAKDPWHRFSTAREYSETLQKALNGQPIERFDREKIQPRIDRAKKAQLEGDHQFASEILTELEAEGNIDPEMTLLRIQLDQAIRQKSIRQLLDTARTRLEENEFPLALQKIQEVLDIDPDNADAITLRKQIEKQRSESQTQNWFRLVEQHLHNNAFSQARQALEEILKVNSRDNRAREMLQEVDRREQEITRLRAEKEQLYQSAVNCYQHGEVSSALSKLERVLEMHRESPDSAIPERDAQYQSLYNQIRTERDSARSSYAEGRRHLADRNFSKALELCAEFLKKSPGDPMFQALKLEAEEQQRQEQSSFIADIARRVEAEADLDRRVNILKEATERYPDEPHFQQSLRLVRERRDLVNSIVSKARQYEERGQFNEALSQFDILRNIYAQYPGLEFETERLKRRRDEQVREEAKARWIDQIDRHIAAGDYARARDLVRTASSEYPNDRELSGLERIVQQALQRASEAEEWLQRGQQLCFDRQFGEGLEALRKAATFDSRNPVIRAALLNALVEQARSVLGQDWRAAEPLVEQALNIDGAHPLAKSLQGLVLDYKRQEIVNDCVSQAREMQANGDVNGALTKVEEVLAVYPNEVRLVQLRATLRNLGGVSQSQPAPPPEAAAAPDQNKSENPPSTLQETVSLGGQRATISDKPFTIDRSMAGTAAALKPAPLPKPAPPAARPPTRLEIEIRGLIASAGSHLSRGAKLLRDWAEPKGRLSRLQWLLLISAPVLVILAFAVSRRGPKPTPVPVPIDYYVDVESNVLNAKFRVDGNPPASLPVRLRGGEHKVEAFVAGYKPAAQSFNLAPGAPKPFVVKVVLEPELIRLRLTSDLKSGQVKLDDQPPVDLQEDGSFLDEKISLSTDHTFSLLQSGKESMGFSFRADPGGIVTILGTVKSKDVNAVVIANLASHSRVYATDSALKGGLKDQASQTIPPEGLDIGDFAANSELLLENGKSPSTYPMEASNAPTLTIRLASDPNQGTLEINAGMSGVQLSIDGRPPKPLRAGINPRGMSPGFHRLRFTREGYDALEQRVEVKKGETLPISPGEWKAVIRTASLSIEGATRDAEVLIDGSSRSSTGSSGSFRADDVPPGTHTITLRKPEFEDKHIVRDFTVGQTIQIAGLDAQLTPYGTLSFRVTPPNATVTYKAADEAQPHPADNGKEVRVKAGRYVVTASANGYRSRPEPVTVEPGKSATIEFVLSAVTPEVTKKAADQAPKPIPTRDYFQNPAEWTEDGPWSIHKGADISWLRSGRGVFRIELLRQSKKLLVVKTTRHVEWVVDYRGADNRIEYSFDFATLERKVTVDGKSEPKKTVRVAAANAANESYTLQIDISADRIIVSDAKGTELDRYDRKTRAALGKFGFKGEVGLAIKRADEK